MVSKVRADRGPGTEGHAVITKEAWDRRGVPYPRTPTRRPESDYEQRLPESYHD